jgi:hypothetical protein
MDRKRFLKNSLLVSGAALLPNALWAFGKKTGSKFVSIPNLKRFKVAANGAKFFETQLSVLKSSSKQKLNRKYFISEDADGYGTPTLLEANNEESFVFIPELYDGDKHNGFIVKLCADGLCEETKIFTHENQGFYAFWGKEYLQQPTLYHYNAETFHLMRAHHEHGQWINHRVMPIYPDEMRALYKQQLKQVTADQLPQQFGYDFEIHKDGFYQFLMLKNGWEQGVITKQREAFEAANPGTIYTKVSKVSSPCNNFSVAFDTYTDPFIPIYCEGDDIGHTITKPAIFYKELAGTKIEIPNMPAYRNQDGFGECRAFSVAVLMQKYTCDSWGKNIPDCQNPPPEYDISYFGMQIYTNRNLTQNKTYQPNQIDLRPMYNILTDISNNPSFILNSCKPFEKMIDKLHRSRQQGLDDQDRFFEYLKKLYDAKKSSSIDTAPECEECLNELERFTGMDKQYFNLKKALSKDNFDKFMYVLFFDGCRTKSFADGFHPVAYPDDNTNAMPTDCKFKAIEGLKKGKPVLFPSLCLTIGKDNNATSGHSVVIAGYKKVYRGNVYKEVFKVHNSWGIEWQRLNNDGWVDADVFMAATLRIPNQNASSRVQSGAVLWLEQH